MNASEYGKQRMQHADKYKPFDQSLQTAQTVHQYIKQPNIHKCTLGQISGAEEATEAHSEVGDPATGKAWEEPAPGETTGIVPRLLVDTVAHGPTGQEKNARPQTKSVTIVGDLDIFQKYADKDQTIRIVKRLQSNTLTWRNSPQTTFRVSTPPHILSPMSK